MTRIVVAVTVILGIAGAIYWQGGRDATRDHREHTLEKSKDISDAINSCADLPWHERLLCRE